MAYIKLIQSGSLIEEWIFERPPSPKRLERAKPRVRRVFPRERRADSIVRCRNSFRRLVRANLSRKGAPALLTLNTRAIFDVSEGYKAFTYFGQLLRRQFGNDLSWIAVPEFQKRGAVHFHVLIWGLPMNLACSFSKSMYTDKKGKKHRKHACPIPKLCERRTRRIASVWSHGFADIMETDGSPRLSSYLAKYMSKAMHDKRLIGKRAYSATRNVMRPVSFNTALQVSSVKEHFGIDEKYPIAQFKEYATMWLGRCAYRQFIVEIAHETSNNG